VRFARLYSHRQGIRVNWMPTGCFNPTWPVQLNPPIWNGKNKRNFLHGQGNLTGIAHAES